METIEIAVRKGWYDNNQKLGLLDLTTVKNDTRAIRNRMKKGSGTKKWLKD